MIKALTNLDRSEKRIVLLAVDCLLVLVSYALAMALRLDGFGFVERTNVWAVLWFVLPASLGAFLVLGFYRTVLRFIGAGAFRTMATGVIISAGVMMAASQLLTLPVPRSVPFIYAALLLLALSGVRFGWRALVDMAGAKKREPVLIYGAGEAGRQLARALQQGPEYRPVGFIDDDKSLQGTYVNGSRVVAPKDAERLIRAHDVRTVLMAMPSASRAQRRSAVEALRPFVDSVKTVPGMAEIVRGAVSGQLRDVQPEDLLGRDPVPPMPGLMGTNINGKVVLVTGAGGSIGSELCRQIVSQNPRKLVLFDISEYALYRIEQELRPLAEALNVGLVAIMGSVLNQPRMKSIMTSQGVQTVYHAAAYKHVPLVEHNVIEGVVNNVFGTRATAIAAAESGVEAFTLISTDKAVRPTNIMGASKRMAELVCQAMATQSNKMVISMVRFGNVLGSSGSVLPKFHEQIYAGGPVTVTHPDVTRFFMTIPEAAQLVIQAGAMARGGDVFVLDMGEPVRILDLAQSVVRLHGLQPVVVDGDTPPAQAAGTIPIVFTGLRPGEKLYEELLIGNNPSGTTHPRIMTANEVRMPPDELRALLERISTASAAYDVAAVRDLLVEAPTEYRPNTEIADFVWTADHGTGLPAGRASVVKLRSDGGQAAE